MKTLNEKETEVFLGKLRMMNLSSAKNPYEKKCLTEILNLKKGMSYIILNEKWSKKARPPSYFWPFLKNMGLLQHFQFKQIKDYGYICLCLKNQL